MRRIRQMGAVFIRDFRIQISYPFHIVSQLIGIGLSLFSIFFLGRLVGSSRLLDQYEGGYFEFALVGLVVMVLAGAALRSFNSSVGAESGNKTLEILLSSPFPLGALVLGWLLWPLFIATVEGAVTFGLGLGFAEGSIRIAGLLAALIPLVLTIGTFLAVGLAAGAFSVITKRGDILSPLYLGATTLLAGAIYPVDVLPGWLATIAQLFPAFHGFNAMRALLIGGAGLADVSGELLLLLAFNLVMIPLGMLALNRALRYARITGTLSTG